MLEYAVKGNKEILNDFLELEIYDSAGYDHGLVLIKLIEHIGETKFLELTKSLSNKSKSMNLNYLEAGILYGSKNQSIDSLAVKFPTLIKEWSFEK